VAKGDLRAISDDMTSDFSASCHVDLDVIKNSNSAAQGCVVNINKTTTIDPLHLPISNIVTNTIAAWKSLQLLSTKCFIPYYIAI